LLVSANM